MATGETIRPPAAAAVHTSGRPVLRVLGTAVTLREEIRRRAEEDLGIAIEFIVLDGVAAQHRAVTQPGSFDVYDQWFHSIEILWLSGATQPIRTSRIGAWDQISRHDYAVSIGGRQHLHGNAPLRRLYVQADKRLGPQAAEYASALPGVYNVDSFGYLPDALDSTLQGQAESWAWILDDRFRGRAALVADPAIGPADAALAIQALGLASFGDVGDLTIAEIDQLVGILLRKKRAGHFRAFWNSIDEAANLVADRGVAIESMWSPTLAALRARGVPIRYAAPKEGYRGWHGCMALSAHTRGRALDVAYEYLNWWMEGWAGAVMARQGYYMSASENVRRHLLPEEWAYWYMGEPAARDLPGLDGHVAVPAGSVREGGSYLDRVFQIAVWNTTMPEHNYLVRRWSQLLAS